jgi:8-amino-7-oxononanoate synthase
MECGFVADVGEAIVADTAHFAEFLDRLANEIEQTARSRGADIVLFRDVRIPRLEAYRPLLNRGYRALWGFPLAIMPLAWKTFDAYLGSLKSDTRRNIRRRRQKLATSDIAFEVLKNFEGEAATLAALWAQTNTRAGDYQHEKLDANYFREVSHQLGDRSETLVIRAAGKPVGISTCLVGDDAYYTLHCGLDYDFDGGGVYHNINLFALERAITCQKKVLNMGITSYDLKMELGAQAESVAYFVKHVSRPELTGTLARMFGKSIKQPENIHKPFRDQTEPLGTPPQALETILSKYQGEPPAHDVFRKAFFYDRISEMKITHIYSFFPAFEGVQNPEIARDGKPIIMLGSNSYLGLASHPRVKEAAIEAIERYGTGCSGSPILNGTLDIHVALARELAEFMGKEDALLFSTGYQTNVGIVSALVHESDVVIMDELDHASLIDGALLSRSRIVRYRHNNMEMLESLMERYRERPKLIVVDSVFSMEGTIANLPVIVRLAKQYDARILLDEAHGIGVLGPFGRGAAEHFGLLDQIDLVMGTFSKSFASVGGFVAGDAWVIDYLRHNARSHLFSASLPPASVAAVRAALEILRSEPERRSRLLLNAKMWSEGLQELGYEAPYHGTAIVPVHCGDDVLALGMFKELLKNGVFVNPVLPPAVPKSKALLRTSLMATHDWTTLDRALRAFANARTPEYPGRPHGAVNDSANPISAKVAIHPEYAPLGAKEAG